jgi:hypothetical protein
VVVRSNQVEANVRNLLVVAGILAVALPLLARPLVAAQAQAGGNPSGVLGPVNALGQQFRLPPPPTSPPPRLPDGTIDLSDGIWVNRPFGPQSGLQAAEELLLPPAKALMAARKETDDPQAWCLLMGVLRYSPYPFRFIQNSTHKKPTHMYILSELMRTYRQIFMDGRTHPAELDPTWFGHSIGWYEKDTLVIDTVGLNDKSWFSNRRMPHTEQLHTVERWTRIDAGHLVTEVTLDDPGAFSRPFNVTYQSEIRPAGDELMEYVCQENNQYGVASGVR